MRFAALDLQSSASGWVLRDRVKGLRFGVEGSGVGVQGCRLPQGIPLISVPKESKATPGFGFQVSDFAFRVRVSRIRASDSRVLGFSILSFGPRFPDGSAHLGRVQDLIECLKRRLGG